MKSALIVFISVVAFSQTELPRAQQPWEVSLAKAEQLALRSSTDAEAEYLNAANLARATAGDNGVPLAQVRNDLAIHRNAQGRYHEADELLRQSISIFERHPNSVLDLAASLHDLAMTCRYLSRRQESEALYRRAIVIIEQSAGVSHRALVPMLTSLSSLLLEIGRLRQAEPLLRRALQIGEKVYGDTHQNLVNTLVSLGEARRSFGDHNAARSLGARALRIVEKTLGPTHLDAAGPLNQLARVEFETSRFRNASKLWERSLDILESNHPSHHTDVLGVLSHLAQVAVVERRFDNAEHLLLRIVNTERASRMSLAIGLHLLAWVYAQQNRHAVAEPLFRRSMSISEPEAGIANAELAACLADFGPSLVALGKIVEAEAVTGRSIAIIEQTSGISHAWHLELLDQHVQLLRKLKRKQDAEQVSNRLKSLRASGTVNAGRHTVDVTELKSR